MPTTFVTLSDVSDALGRDVTGDPGGTAAVSSACAICRSEAQQTFDLGMATIRLDGNDGDALILPEAPATVGTVSVNGVVVTDWMMTNDGLLLRGSAGVGGNAFVSRPTWPMGRQNVQVTYTFGYPDLQVPEDVSRVALDLAIRIMVQGPVQSETIGDVSVTYAQPHATDLSDNERRILRRYRGTRSF